MAMLSRSGKNSNWLTVTSFYHLRSVWQQRSANYIIIEITIVLILEPATLIFLKTTTAEVCIYVGSNRMEWG